MLRLYEWWCFCRKLTQWYGLTRFPNFQFTVVRMYSYSGCRRFYFSFSRGAVNALKRDTRRAEARKIRTSGQWPCSKSELIWKWGYRPLWPEGFFSSPSLLLIFTTSLCVASNLKFMSQKFSVIIKGCHEMRSIFSLLLNYLQTEVSFSIDA